MIFIRDDKVMTRDQLGKVPIVTRGIRSETWEGIQHGELATTIIKVCKAMDFKVVGESWSVNNEKTAMIGSVDLDVKSVGNKLDIGTPACFAMSVRHANDGRAAVAFGVGARLVTTQTGILIGEHVLKRCYVNTDPLDKVVEDGINSVVMDWMRIESQIKQLQQYQLKNTQAAYLILKASRDKLLNFSYLKEIDDCWYNPTAPMWSARTAWTLYNCFNHAARNMSPAKQLILYKGLYKMFDKVLKLSEVVEKKIA